MLVSRRLPELDRILCGVPGCRHSVALTSWFEPRTAAECAGFSIFSCALWQQQVDSVGSNYLVFEG